ncbi:hypothetical protein [uncultured Bradyrhizobium sp.]|uniref:hypothetical protein n=1 Tax=uncultured Bradyrhizobium sp. TaxID=199684 RepID=UPI0035C9F4CE
MNQRYDLLAIALLFFTTILTIWLVTGPMNFALKEWQPLMASLIAFIAGTYAYKGAMAKVNYDRDRELRDLARKRLGLYLRLRYASEKLVVETRNVRMAVGFNISAGTRKTGVYAIKIAEKSEFNESWENLDLFPVSISVHIDAIRTKLPRAIEMLASFPDTTTFEVPATGPRYNDPVYRYANLCGQIEDVAATLIKSLDAQIGNMNLD